jgi:hypothetical protein
MLATDSPVIAYFSGWPPERIRGTARLEGAYHVAVIPDRRYARIYPVLKRHAQLLSGTAPPGWRLRWMSRHWSIRYGAKPVRIYTVPADGPTDRRLWGRTIKKR